MSDVTPVPEPTERSLRYCPSCRGLMLPARLLVGYEKSGSEAERSTCPLHGPLGPFQHIGGDR
jgi:hypothetical protein